MGRPDEDPSASEYESQQIQTEYEPNHEVLEQQQMHYQPPQPNYYQNNVPMYYSNKPNQVPAGAAYPPQAQPQPVQYPPPKSPQAFPQPNSYGLRPGPGGASASPYNYKPAGGPAVAGFPVVPGGGGEAWRSGLFDFMDDPNNALTTAFFPCLTFGQIAEIVDEGHTTCGTSGLLYGAMTGFAMPCLLSCTYRTKLRNKFGLPEAPAPDWVTHFLCECCALCQEYRELQHRGWDPTIGWNGNMTRNQIQMQQLPVMMAPMDQRMMG